MSNQEFVAGDVINVWATRDDDGWRRVKYVNATAAGLLFVASEDDEVHVLTFVPWSAIRSMTKRVEGDR